MVMKKINKRRGCKTGYGAKKKHRGSGSRGGVGRSGSFDQKKTFILRYDRDHVGKRGFVSKTGKDVKAINLDELQKLAVGKTEIDAGALGYDKVLGGGKVVSKLVLTADAVSKRAREKIEAAGGEIRGADG